MLCRGVGELAGSVGYLQGLVLLSLQLLFLPAAGLLLKVRYLLKPTNSPRKPCPSPSNSGGMYITFASPATTWEIDDDRVPSKSNSTVQYDVSRYWSQGQRSCSFQIPMYLVCHSYRSMLLKGRCPSTLPSLNSDLAQTLTAEY